MYLIEVNIVYAFYWRRKITLLLDILLHHYRFFHVTASGLLCNLLHFPIAHRLYCKSADGRFRFYYHAGLSNQFASVIFFFDIFHNRTQVVRSRLLPVSDIGLCMAVLATCRRIVACQPVVGDEIVASTPSQIKKAVTHIN